MGRERLTRDDWAAAALAAIQRGGLAAVAVEPLARTLGVTKGSFYAHFRDRGELVEAALERWERVHLEAFERAIQADRDPVEHLRSLMEMATAAARGSTIQGRLLLESDDPRVRAALRRVTELRLERLESIFDQLGDRGDAAARRATIAYATYVGLLQLAREVPERLADEQALVGELARMLAPTDISPP